MVVKNGYESPGRIRTKIINKNKSKNILALFTLVVGYLGEESNI